MRMKIHHICYDGAVHEMHQIFGWKDLRRYKCIVCGLVVELTEVS